MTSSTDLALTELLYRCKDSEHGLAVRTNNPPTLRNKLKYLIQKEELEIKTAISGDEVWLIPKENEL